MTFGGLSGTSFSKDSDTQITVTTPGQGADGAVDVVVQSPYDNATETNGFTYYPPRYLFFSNEGTTSTNGYLTYCEIYTTNSGVLENCNNYSNSSVFSYPTGVAISSTGFLYTANQGTNTISTCSPGSQPSTITCSNSSAGGLLNSPRTTYLNNGHLYVLNYTNNTVVICNADASTGALSSCQTTGSTFARPLGSMSIYNGYAYIPNSSGSVNSVSICAVNSTTGLLSGCYQTTGQGTITASPSGVAHDRIHAYIIGVWTRAVVTCKINSSTGDLENCFTNSNILGGSTPSGISYVDGYLYVLAHQPNLVLKCNTSLSGIVSNCVTETSPISSKPSGNLSSVTAQ